MDEAMLSAATEKAIVTKMTPPELATHLKLNADRYSAYAQMKWQVVELRHFEAAEPPKGGKRLHEHRPLRENNQQQRQRRGQWQKQGQ